MVNHMTNNRICQAGAEDMPLESPLLMFVRLLRYVLRYKFWIHKGACDQMESGTAPIGIPKETGEEIAQCSDQPAHINRWREALRWKHEINALVFGVA